MKNAFGLVNRLKGLTIDALCSIVSFDVVSLFTNIPLDLLDDIIEARWNEIQLHTNIPKMEFLQLLNFVTRDCNQFVYNNEVYKQINGLPIGSPLSPILADMVMEYILDQALDKLKYIKYVDDLLLIVPTTLLQDTLNVSNSIQDPSEVKKL